MLVDYDKFCGKIEPSCILDTFKGAVLMTDEARNMFLKAWQTKKQESIHTHIWVKDLLGAGSLRSGFVIGLFPAW